MSNDSELSSESVPRRRLSFSLLSLFFAVSIIGLFLSWWVQPRKYLVESIFHLDATPHVLLSKSKTGFDQREYDLLRRTHSDLIRSEMVVTSALRDPKIAGLSILQSQEDQVAWVREHLQVLTFGDSELLTIQMRCSEDSTSEFQLLVDAMSDAYLKNVVFDDEQRRLVVRDLVLREVSELRDRLEKNMSAAEAISDENSTKRKLTQLEIEAQCKLLQELIREQEAMNFGGSQPDRVRRVQKASIRPE